MPNKKCYSGSRREVLSCLPRILPVCLFVSVRLMAGIHCDCKDNFFNFVCHHCDVNTQLPKYVVTVLGKRHVYVYV
jgi:hypothetical protein